MKIKTKLLLTAAIAISLSVAIPTVIHSHLSKEALTDRLTEIEIPAVLGEISTEITNELITPITVARGIATLPANQQMISDNLLVARSQMLVDYLKYVKQEYHAIATAFVDKRTGNLYNDEGLFKIVSPVATEDAWFYKFLQSEQKYSLNIQQDEKSKKMALFINYVVEQQGQRVGSAGIGFLLEKMAELIRHYRIGESGRVFLTDGSGKIVVHGD